VRTFKQLIDDPRGVGSEEDGMVTAGLQEHAEGAPDHGVRAEDGYGCGMGVLPHFGDTLSEIDL